LTLVGTPVAGSGARQFREDGTVQGINWAAYVDGFHATRPGITESVLGRSRADDADPYAWLAEAVPPRGRVLDLGCGSAPMFRALPGRSWIGLDTSPAELAAARSAGARPLLRASAAAIPLRDASVDAVVCSMSLMVVTPLAPVIAEISRVLRPGGLLAATIPAAGPLRPPDLASVAGLIAALGRAPGYPGGLRLPGLPALLASHGLLITADTRRRFGYRLRGPADAGQLLSSLYLPGTSAGRARLARAYLRVLARRGYEMPVPLRRVTAERADSGPRRPV
jgi:SAM-dependent methyltransferase